MAPQDNRKGNHPGSNSHALSGPIADKYSPRTLLVLSLALTALGGLVMARIPGIATMYWLYAYWMPGTFNQRGCH